MIAGAQAGRRHIRTQIRCGCDVESGTLVRLREPHPIAIRVNLKVSEGRGMTDQSLFPTIRLRAAADAVSLSIGKNVMPLSGVRSRGAAAMDALDVSARRLLSSVQSGYSVRDIKSAEIDRLAGDASQTVHRLLVAERTARQRRENEIAVAQAHAGEAYADFAEWDAGFFWKRIRPGRFRELGASLENARRRLEALMDERERAVLVSEIEVSPDIAAAFEQLRIAFRALALSEKIWDTLSEQRTNQVAERTAATHAVVRRPVQFSVASSDIIFRDWPVPRLANANGGDLYFYPGCLLYSVSNETFALVDARDVKLQVRPMRFHESDALPHDAKQLGHTWLKVNKDGTPDRRFASNRPIPVLEYAELTLATPSGVNEEYLISNYSAAAKFGAAWAAYQQLFI